MSVTCEAVDLDHLDTAPVRHTASEEVAASPDEIFAVLLDATSWTRWVWAITGVEWTSPFPLEPGSTRTVHMRGGLVAHERFLAFEHGRRMAFRFEEVNKGSITAFAEDYQVTDLGGGRSRVDWVMAMTPAKEGSSLGRRLRDPLMGWFVRRTLRKLRTYVESRPTLEASG